MYVIQDIKNKPLINCVDIQKRLKMVGKSAMELVLGFVGKTHALNMYGLFSLTSFGAFFVFYAPSAHFWTETA